MTLADDAGFILSVWGETGSIQRLSTTYNDNGSATKSWSEQSTPTILIQPLSGDTENSEVGRKSRGTHEIYIGNGTDVLEGDRIRPSGWSAGDDEYEVKWVENFSPSHVRVEAELVKGRGD